MFAKPTIIFAVVCVAFLCLSQNSEGKPFVPGDVDGIQDDGTFPKDMDQFFSKRDIQPIGLTRWEHCYRIRYRDPGCRKYIQRPQQRINLITV